MFLILLTAVIMLGKSGDWERNAYVAITGCVTVRFCVTEDFYHITDGWRKNILSVPFS